MTRPPLYAFTFIRNGIKFDYPFLECYENLAPLVDCIYVAVGQGEDQTLDLVSRFPKVKVIPTVWDDQLRAGGLVFSSQVNIALKALRADHPKGWGFYLNADEVLAEWEYETLLKDLNYADQNGYDAISLRFIHFWKRYDQIAIAKRWYPDELRLIRLETPIVSFGDSQSFLNVTKPYFSNANVYHYGHVRNEESFEQKNRYFHRFWHAKDSEIDGLMQKGKVKDAKELTVRYLGPHPQSMLKRIQKTNFSYPQETDQALILGYKDEFSPDFSHKIRVKKIYWKDDRLKGVSFKKNEIVPLHPNWFEALQYRSHVPKKMYSQRAVPWTKEFYAVLKLSEKGIAFY